MPVMLQDILSGNMSLPLLLLEFITLSLIVLVVLPVHEMAHGYVAYRLGDPTEMCIRDRYSGSPNYGIDFTYSNEDYNDYNSVVSSEGEATRAPVLKIGYSYSAASGISTNTVYYIKACLLYTSRCV